MLDDLLGRLTGEAGVDRVLLVGGDRDAPAGPFESSLQVLQTGLLQKHGIQTTYLACYPEGHPRIDDEALAAARREKLAYAQCAGLRAGLVSQFCFEAAPIARLAKELRDLSPATPLRAGIAGPASHATLLKYAIKCGVGASLRALRERGSLLAGLAAGATPERLLHDLAASCGDALHGVHFFTFGSLGRTIELVSRLRVLSSVPQLQELQP